jgi:hypothetical protein
MQLFIALFIADKFTTDYGTPATTNNPSAGQSSPSEGGSSKFKLGGAMSVIAVV